MAYDPLSILREVLARRPDLHREFAPRLQAMGVQVAGPSFSGETRRRLDANAALQSGTVPPTTLGPVPTNMGGFPPRATTESANMEFDRERQRALMRSPFGDQEPMGTRNDLSAAIPSPLAPGSQDYAREAQRAAMRSPMGDQGPLDPGNALPPELTARGPMPPSFGAGPGSSMARLPQFRPSFAPGTAEASLPPSPPQARPGIMPGPVPANMGSFPQRPTLAGDTGGLSPQIAALMGGSSPLAPSVPPSGAPFSPYGPNASLARMPQSRPPQMPQARPDYTPSPLSPDQRIANVPGAGPAPPVNPAIAAAAQRASAPPVAGFDPRSPFSRPTSPQTPDLRGPNLDLAAGMGYDQPPFGAPLGSTSLSPLVQDYATGAGAAPAQLARMPRPRPPIEQQPGDLIAKPATPPTEAAASPPGPLSFTPESVRQMGLNNAQALYNQPPPGMTLPPGVTQQDVGRLGFGATNIDPSKAPVQRYGSGTGKYAGAALGALKGLAGGPVGALVGGALGYQGGKRLGGLADRDFGLGARFRNPNYAQGVVANPPAIMDMGVAPITPSTQTPIMQAGTGGGIFGTSRNAVAQVVQRVQGMLQRGEVTRAQAASMIRDASSGMHDSMGSAGSGGMGMGGWSGSGGWGGGSSYTGGGYGGNAGGNINEGVGQRFGQR